MKRIITLVCVLALTASAYARDKIIVNCTTGVTTIVKMSAGEEMQRSEDAAKAVIEKAEEDAKAETEKKIQAEIRAIAIKSLQEKGEL